MKVVVAHHYWARPGGGEIVSSATVQAFKECGYEVSIVSLTKFNPEKYIDWFGIDIRDLPIYSLPIEKLRMFGIYMRLLYWIPLRKAIKVEKPNLVWTDNDTYKPILKLKRKLNFKIVEYIHYPFSVLWQDKFRDTPLHWSKDPYFKERYGKFPMNIYFNVWLKLHKRMVRDNPFTCAELVFANSKWTAKLVEDLYEDKPIVLNPPIPPATEIVSNPKPFEERKNIVIMIGRYSGEKRYEWVIRNIAPKLEKHGVELMIVGGTGTKISWRYYNYLSNLVNKLGLNNVYLIANASRDDINKLLDTSKVLLHATINEHWGVVVTEAMARGVPVVVHKSGGAWTDAVEEGNYGLGYETDEECIEQILKVIHDRKLWQYYSQKGLLKAKELTYEKYKEKLINYVEKIL